MQGFNRNVLETVEWQPCLRSEEIPFEVGGRIMPQEFFFHPNNKPVMETIRKKAKRKIAIVRCIFLKTLIRFADL